LTVTHQICKKKNKLKPHVLLNKSAGLISSGEFHEAQALLQEININLKKYDSTCKAIYYNNSICVYLALNNLEKAQEYNSKLMEIQIVKSLSTRVKESIYDTEAMLYIASGDYKKGESILKSLLKYRLSMNLKLDCMFRLALIDIKEGKLADAKEKLNYIIMNGNKLYIVKEAQIKFDQLSG